METLQLPKRPNTKYDFGSMAIGDTFIVEPEKRASVKAAAHQYVTRLKMAKSKKPAFSILTYEDKVLRCVRTK